MNEEELKALVGDKAFEAMSKEQRAAAIAKYTPPKDDDKDKNKNKDDDKDKNKNKGGKADDSEDDDNEEDDLRDKVRKEKEAKDKNAGEIKGIEKALKFNLAVADFVKGNVDLLPSEAGDLLRAAEKETYDTAKEKASAIQAALVQSFFAVQSNVDLLTTSQKAALDDYLKLTKNGKEQKAPEIYENLFEPALETLKKVKKAEELGKARMGFASSSKAEDSYKQKLMAGSRKAYLNEKETK